MLYSSPDNHQYYNMNTNEITDNHNIAIWNDITINMVPLPYQLNHQNSTLLKQLLDYHSHKRKDLPNNIQTQVISILQFQLTST